MQEFLGLGFSIHKAKNYLIPSDQAIKEKLYSETFRSFNTVVFWSYVENPQYRDLFITEAQKYGLKRIIVNPIGEPLSALEHANTVFGDIKEYMDAGYPVYGTTIMNKPNTDESGTLRQDPSFLVECAKLLRFKLDSAGYTDIKIAGPSTIEWSPYIDPTLYGAAHGYSFQDGDNLNYTQALINDTEALGCVDAFDYQSYGWSVSNQIQNLADQYQKDLWVTLSATDGMDNDNGDPVLGPISVATILANLNHGVRSWNHWVWDQLVSFSTGNSNKRMKMIQQIGLNFKEGATIKRCIADDGQVSPDMFWNYYDINNPENNQQPEIIASAARNPDNSLVGAVVNITGIHAQHFASVYEPSESKTYNVEMVFEDLDDDDLGLFSVYQTSPDGLTNFEGKLLLKSKKFIYPLLSQNLLVAVSDTILENVTSLSRKDAPSNLIAKLNEDRSVGLSWTDNSNMEEGYLIERRLKGISAYTFSDTLEAGITNYIDKNDLGEGRYYEYRLSAYRKIDLGSEIILDTIVGNIAEVFINPVSVLRFDRNDLQIYPNPSSGTINLKMDIYPGINVRVRVFNQTGNLVFDKKLNPTNPVNLSHLEKGIYYLRLGEDSVNIVKKLIIY
ncbi:MAG: T9SS type A sorting domain-containing protein [Bacteroidales bacterium]